MLKPQDLAAVLTAGNLTAHPDYPTLLVEKTSDGSLFIYNSRGMLHNPHGAAILRISGKEFNPRFYLEGKDVSYAVRDLIEQGMVEYDADTNLWDENAIVSISLAEG